MIQGDNFKVITGDEAEVSLAAWQLSHPRGYDTAPTFNHSAPAPPRAPDPLRYHKKWTKQEDGDLKRLWLTMSDAELGSLFLRNQKAIVCRRQKLGLVGAGWTRP